MAAEIPTTEPLVFVAGTSWDWNKTLGDFPASAWQLTYYFVALEAASKDLTAAWGAEVTANGDTFEVRILPADTDTEVAEGAYDLLGVVTNPTTSKTHQAVNVRVRMLANPATRPGSKSLAKFMVEALETSLKGGVLTADQLKISINGRSIETAPEVDRRNELAYWKLTVLHARKPGMRLSRAAAMVDR